MINLGRKNRNNFAVHSNQWYPTVEALYRAKLPALLSLAKRHVYRHDLALDVVHDALAKSLVYFQKHPDKKVREQIVHFQILKACKRANKYSVEFASGLLNQDPEANDE